MTLRRQTRTLLTTTALSVAVFGSPVHAQDLSPAAFDGAGAESAGEAIVVTGSRIRRAPNSDAAPVLEVGQQQILDRGYVSVADALNDLPSNVPTLNQADGSGASSGSGIQAPNLFGLGAGRTLTLLNGRRMVTSSSGIGGTDGVGDAQVDSNILPLGLLERVEVYQGGGAAVYGSDAIAGTVNYILKKDFTGIVLDGQTGISDRGDYGTYSLRGTAGFNFAEGRGNFAVDMGWSKSPSLRFSDRPLSNLGRLTVSNSADTGPTDGIPSVKEIFNAGFWPFNGNGVIFTAPAPPPSFLLRNGAGSALQFGSDGSVIPYDPGTIQGIPFASDGEGFPYQELAGLRTGVERLTANAIGHYDLTDRITLSAEFLYANTKGREIPQGNSRTVLNGGTYAGPIAFTINNAFLTDEAKAALIAARPSFANGAPLFLSKYFYDLVPDPVQTYNTDTWRGALTLDGDFDVGSRNFYWSVSGSYARVEGRQRSWQVVNSRYNNAINSVLSGGQAVCAINADADATNDDASCAPINPFGTGTVSDAARKYVSTRAGLDWTNEQIDVLATLGGTLFSLPMGDVQFSAAYEHRDEKAAFSPLQANLDGVFGDGSQQVAQSGGYNTDELSAEVIVPLIGRDFTLPLVKLLEFKGAFRYVDNSFAGRENVWDAGLRWEVTDGVTLRGSRSRNFRAPTLTQLLAPTSTTIGSAGYDPCDADRINAGANPAVRRANCLALFTANPGYGVDPDGTGSGMSAAERLARFQSPAENFNRTTITSGGNPNLRNEISDTLTYGIVLQPRFVPGLSISVDRIEIDLKDGLSPFTTEDFAAACFDDPNPSESVCSAFTRLTGPDSTSIGGTIVTGTTTTFNAGVVKYRGETYTVDYAFAPGDLFGGSDLGSLRLTANATHNTLLTTSVTGTTFIRTDDTYRSPEWVGRFNAVWDKGPVRVSYQLDYLGRTRAAYDATIETTPNPILKSNIVHSISAQVEAGNMTFRAGIDNLTDKAPSYPQIAYGDILGRRFFVGARIKLK
ncbi:TonB-dependent receptor [Novosphingobium sp. fls2-241-R2A-195]|jgi:outer membrane receptor protein involved in Fe transport|uniref:TonB-dependent receptor domain-containing protein n=1 Tax=Novosphingobium sp. fls2-241-R2A-195 TaxID=3040296 RepID=UPI00254E9D93|nr:TonB-dependent receptor [Novosphingobium sp. fls2-241-R2A-195]